MVSNSTVYTDHGKINFDHGIIHPSYSGVSLLLSWIYLLFYANSAGIEAAAPISLMGTPYTLSSACMSAAVLVIAFGSVNMADRIMSTRIKVIASVLTSVGTGFMILGGTTEMSWLVLVGSVVTGIFSGIMAQQWVVAYRRVGLKTIICSFPALLALAVGICMTLMYLPPVYIFLATILLPIVSGFMLHAVRKFLYPIYEIDTSTSNRPFDYALIVFSVGIFAFSSGFLDFFSNQSGYTFFFYVAVSAILFMTACVFVLISNRENAFICLILPLCFMVSEFIPFLVMIDNVPAAHFISIGELGIEIALFSVAIGFAEFFSLSALKTYALCRVTHTVLNAVGWYVSGYSSAAFSELMNSQASLAVVFIGIEIIAVCLIVAIVKAQKVVEPQIDSIESPIESLMGDDAQECIEEKKAVISKDISQDIDASCIELGRMYSLSNREMDVFRLLAKGYTAVGIQSELYIAPGTVNYHTRNIYAKLGVHSKQELIHLVSGGK